MSSTTGHGHAPEELQGKVQRDWQFVCKGHMQSQCKPAASCMLMVRLGLAELRSLQVYSQA